MTRSCKPFPIRKSLPNRRRSGKRAEARARVPLPDPQEVLIDDLGHGAIADVEQSGSHILCPANPIDQAPGDLAADAGTEGGRASLGSLQTLGPD